MENILKAMELLGYEQIDLGNEKLSFKRTNDNMNGDTASWVFQYNDWAEVRKAIINRPGLFENEEITQQLDFLVGMSLEERYTSAMERLGYSRSENPVDSLATLAFVNKQNENDTILVDGWELLGDVLEDAINKSLLNDREKQFVEHLIHPKGRISSYYVKSQTGAEGFTSHFFDFEAAVSQYIDSGINNSKSMGFIINDEERELCSYDVASTGNKLTDLFKLPGLCSDLTVNEREYIQTVLSHISSAINKDNMYHTMENSLKIILDKCKSDILENDFEWGAWFGRVASAKFPQNYLGINIVGYSKHHEIECNISVIHANEIVEHKNCVFKTYPERLEQSMQQGMTFVLSYFDSFIHSAVDKLQTDISLPMRLYSPYSDKSLDDHYDILENAGYERFPEEDNILKEMMDEKVSFDKMEEFVKDFYLKNESLDVICTDKITKALSGCLVKMITSGKMDNTCDAIECVLQKDSTLSFVKSRKPNIDKVPLEVVSAVEKYFEISDGLKNYMPVKICRISNDPHDDYLYAVIGINVKTGEYACWTSWNQSINSLNMGHYNLSDESAALNIIADRFNDISGEPLRFGMKCTQIDIAEQGKQIEEDVNYKNNDVNYPVQQSQPIIANFSGRRGR